MHDLSRRGFLKLSGAAFVASSMAGFISPNSSYASEAAPELRIKNAVETTTICCYCSVGCGGVCSVVDGNLINFEGDPDHPVNRGGMCAKGLAQFNIVNVYDPKTGDIMPNPNRLHKPRYRAAGETEWKDVEWDWAMKEIAQRVKDARDKSFEKKDENGVTVNRTKAIGWMGGAGLDNEECHPLSKLARALGLVYIEHQARLCHSSSVAGLGNSFGRGAMTNHFSDMTNSDLIVVGGSNVAENHPASMRHIQEARNKGAKLVVVDPRYTRSAAVADYYAPIRSGTDILFFGALINYLIQNDAINHEYVEAYTNASWLINPSFSFDDGMFSGWEEADGKSKYDNKQWAYQVESEDDWDTSATGPFAWTKAPGVPAFDTPKVKNVKKDPTLKDPQSVFQLMKKHYERYTPKMVASVCGMTEKQFDDIAQMIAATSDDSKSMTWLYAMGLTQHSKGSQNIRGISVMQLLLGNMGIAGGGINALRGESNVQGSTDMGLLYDSLPGYMTVPKAATHPTLAHYNAAETIPSGYWSNKPKFLVSMLKEYWGDKATIDNDFCFDYLPKLDDKNYSHMSMFEDMNVENLKGLFCWGQNPAVGGPNSNFERTALSKLDWLVAIDLFETDTAAFWNLPMVEGEKADPTKVNTEVFMLPAAAHLEKQGTIANSGRWVQWRYKAVEPAGESKDDGQIMTLLLEQLKELYKAGGEFPDPIVNLHWPYVDEEGHFSAVLSANSLNGYSTVDGKRLENFSKMQADGSTACASWIYSGYFNNNDSEDPHDQPCGARDGSDATIVGLEGGMKQYPQWSWAWPMNRRVLYNRASTFKDSGKPRNPQRPLVSWNGSNWDRNDVPDFAFQSPEINPKTKKPVIGADGKPVNIGNPPAKCPAFFMTGELHARLFAPGMKEGPFPEHYEPYESPVKNKLSGTQNNPAALAFPDSSKFGTADQYPIACSTFRLVEHWQTGVSTRNSPWLAQAMPHMFCEISKELAAEKGIKNGDDIEVFNNRGMIQTKAMVTTRLRPYNLEGEVVHQVNMPWHWGRKGIATGAPANVLTPNVGDANTFIPESKAFLVDIRRKG